MILPDVIEPGLRVVFCGTAAGSKSARAGAYYAGPGNAFWATLHEIGLTPHRLQPREYAELPRFGIGFTDLCKIDSGSDRAVGTRGFDVGRLVEIVDQHRPGIIAFNGKKAAQVAIRPDVRYGPQPEHLAGARVFVVPSTSGAARRFWNIVPWHELARAVCESDAESCGRLLETV